MCHAGYEKWQTTPDRRNGTTKDKIRTLGKKETYKYWSILEADTIKQMEMKEKKLRKNISEELESYSRQNSLAEILSKE